VQGGQNRSFMPNNGGKRMQTQLGWVQFKRQKDRMYLTLSYIGGEVSGMGYFGMVKRWVGKAGQKWARLMAADPSSAKGGIFVGIAFILHQWNQN